jgi:hypothetical protein
MSRNLKGKIAVVAGASRGCGRGIALSLGEHGATVYVTGRTIRGGPPPVDGIFACAVWGGNERFVDPIWRQPFWKLPAELWDDFMGAGPQAFWISAREATRLMAE